MIAQDTISKLISVLGLSIPVYVFLFSNISIIWLVPSFLLIFGLAIQKWLLPRIIPDETVTAGDEGNIAFYTFIAIATFFFLNLVTPAIVTFLKLSELTGYDSVLFGVMMAIGEEQFFRAGWANVLIQASKNEVYGSMAGAAVFMIYHFMAYGDNPSALLFVLGSGFTLILVDLKMGKLAPSLFAHMGNNFLAYSTISTGVVTALVFQNLNILLLMAIVAVIVYLYYQRRRDKKS